MKRAITFHGLLAAYGPDNTEKIKQAGRIVADTVEIEECKLDEIVPGWRTPKPPPPPPQRGPGDVLEAFLRPFVLFMDEHFGTKLEGCSACARRKANMNKWWNAATRWLRVRLNGLRKPRS